MNEKILKHIITESVREALSENFTSRSKNILWEMYDILDKIDKIDYPVDGYDDFKRDIKSALDKLGNILRMMKTGRRSPTQQVGQKDFK